MEPNNYFQAKNTVNHFTNTLVQFTTADNDVVFLNHSQLQDRLGITKTLNNHPVCNTSSGLKVLGGLNELKSCFWYDEFHQTIFTTWKTGRQREWSDAESIALQVYIQDHVGFPRISKDTVFDAVLHYSMQHIKNQPKDWLESISLKWDGISRIERLFIDYFGADDSDYTRAASKNFIISSVARIYSPGCKVDNMVILEGVQGKFKSTGLEALFNTDLYCDAHESVTNKDFFIILRGKWLIEIAELDAFSRAESTRVKQAVTCKIDRYRTPYDRLSKDHPRQCVFAGTTNKDDYLKDETGARRFWPIKTGNIILDKIKADRAQLFAEAVKLYKEGASWWEMPNSARDEQEARRQDDAWESAVDTWLMGKSEVTLTDVAENCLNFNLRDFGISEAMRLAKVLKVLGWTKRDSWRGGKTIKAWFAPKTERPVETEATKTLLPVQWVD